MGRYSTIKNTHINILEDIKLNNPILIEALPGIGHVGKLAIDHVIEEVNAVKFAELFSPSFPPQVIVNEDGLIEVMINEFYYLKSFGEEEQDYILLVGNTQGVSTEGQYEICGKILDFVEQYGVKEIYTLGGIATGQKIEEYTVLGSATSMERIEILEEIGVTIRSADGGIVGASGLLLGMGQLRGMTGTCLMGETPGYFIDAESAEALLNTLMQILKFEVSTEKLEERAEETRKMLSKAQQMEQDMAERMAMGSSDDDLRYIG